MGMDNSRGIAGHIPYGTENNTMPGPGAEKVRRNEGWYSIFNISSVQRLSRREEKLLEGITHRDTSRTGDP